MGNKFEKQLILQAYTFKIVRYYMDHKQLASISQLQQMQRETIDESESETWKQGAVSLKPRKRD